MLSAFVMRVVLGWLTLPWWGYVLVLLGLTQLTVLSVTLYLHRCQSHRALHLHPIVSHFFRFWLWLTTGILTKEWAAIHRKHHAKVETTEDPHSPVTRGITKVLLEGAELYRAEANNRETLNRYGEGTPDDWIERNLYTRHSTLGVSLMLFVNLALFGFLGISIWALQMAWIPFFAAGIINGVGHYVGYRNFECKDNSRNVVPWGFFLGGEELHNNHHAYASSAKFSAKWWEFDIGWSIIKLLQVFGLAKPKKILPQTAQSLNKTTIDAETLKALISYRLHILASYAKEVILPALKEEKSRASQQGRALLKQARKLLIRDTSLMKASHKSYLATLLQNYHSLSVVYQFRVKLQAIWGRSTASQKELLDALQEWCRQAEATGIETLSRFAARIKTYVPQSSSSAV